MLLRSHCAGALDGKELFTIEGSENWRSTPDDLEESEKAAFHDEKPYRHRLKKLSRVQTESTSGSEFTFTLKKREIRPKARGQIQGAHRNNSRFTSARVNRRQDPRTPSRKTTQEMHPKLP